MLVATHARPAPRGPAPRGPALGKISAPRAGIYDGPVTAVARWLQVLQAADIDTKYRDVAIKVYHIELGRRNVASVPLREPGPAGPPLAAGATPA